MTNKWIDSRDADYYFENLAEQLDGYGDGTMGRYDIRECPCGSGKPSQWQFDYRGIELCRTCDDCHSEKMSRYRDEILNGYDQSDVDEPIEPPD